MNVLNYYDHYFISHYYYNGHILNILDYIQEAWWSPTLTPSSSRINLSISGQLQSYCDLIYHHELYVEHFTAITTHYQLLLLFFILSYTSYIILLIEQFLPLPLNKQLLPKYLPLIL
ncbi:unnamed protein product [Rotaria sp. Silwood1]|nr:unnamed protein product [Rotaria sp. Silwood1]CAF5164848.1 unnamed protein product [Rotaria sp. Silwood1]